ncbi:plasmid stabilization protein [Streptomyces sp. CAU 1734]|uniref:plasmid stabilization protein n=1 Tax=Streptomyces sp. CAU 1734 TaxID=3140360 RepID=UPI003261BC6A
MPAGSRSFLTDRAGSGSGGTSRDRAGELAARTVDKERARAGESRTASRTSTRDPKSAPERGGQRSSGGARGPTGEQHCAEARKKNTDGRSTMNTRELKRALGR